MKYRFLGLTGNFSRVNKNMSWDFPGSLSRSSYHAHARLSTDFYKKKQKRLYFSYHLSNIFKII